MFTYSSPHPDYTIFWGDDKYENELLLKYSQSRDVWFHVSGYSSAHIYLRCPAVTALADLPEELVELCAKLTKCNSIEGSKCNSVTIVYTPISNVGKHVHDDVGTVVFKDKKACKYLENVICTRAESKQLARLSKQIAVSSQQLAEEQERYKAELLLANKEAARRERELQQQKEKEELERKRLLHYDDLFSASASRPRDTSAGAASLEDDFM